MTNSGFELYVNALADFLVAPNTRAPLTCSIEGSWGSGKSSFMLQLKNRLRMVAPSSRTIEFNAWKYDKQEELWAAFALKVTRSLREQLRWISRVRYDFRLYRARIKGWTERLSLLALLLTWLLLLCGFGGVIVWTLRAERHERVGFIKTLVGPKDTSPTQAHPLLDPWYNWLSWSPLATSTVVIVLLIGKIPESLRKRLFEAQLEKYIDKPDYKGKAAFVDTFSEDFSKTLEAYAPADEGKVFVFIDDLDRCEAPKAADLMQAINLMIGDGNSLIFILGLDRAKVASSIAFKFREILPYLDPDLDPKAHPESIRNYGDAFLEKFIQLSFRLPISSNETQARRFIDSLITDAAIPATPSTAEPGKSIGEAAADAVAESTRRALRIESGAESQRMKTFLNAFRLALYIASAQRLLDVDSNTGEAEVTPERLGKFLALTSRYPELRSIVEKNPEFLSDLEDLVLLGSRRQQTIPYELLDPWLKKPGIRRLMSHAIVDKTLTTAWARQYSMKDFPHWKFSTILPSVPRPKESKLDAARPAGATSIPSQSTVAAFVINADGDVVHSLDEPTKPYVA